MTALAAPSYDAFLADKRTIAPAVGFEVPLASLNPQLFDWQRKIVRWALQRGRAALFEDCGLGKTPQQLEWGCHVSAHTQQPVLILAPLAVAHQTAREGEKFGVPVTICRTQADVQPGVNVTNYEMLRHFDAAAFGGIVLDESSILKAFGGTLRKQITAFAQSIHFRLACTATPAPNDLTELTNHAEFLDVMSGKEIIALFFTQDGNTTREWRLKGHARADFWRWLGSWSVALRTPSDLNGSDEGFVLPPLRVESITVPGATPEGYLFPVEAKTLGEVRAAQRASLPARVDALVKLVNAGTAKGEQWVVWCHLNEESERLAKLIHGAVEVRGSDSSAHKEESLLAFAEGRARVLVSKPSICGYGMNWQHCARVAFVGLSYSYEQFYQAIRRCWRFGQTQEVRCYVVSSETEGAVVRAIEEKEAQAKQMMGEIVSHMSALHGGKQERDEMVYREDVARGDRWTAHLGDSVLRIDEVETESQGLIVYSPPFPGMYAYTNSVHDMGNTRDLEQMLAQYRYLIQSNKLLRVLKPGRICAVHLCQTMAHKSREGWMGLHDFRGQVIRTHQEEGWIYYGEVTIDKNPQVSASRTKEAQLLFKTLAENTGVCRPTLADYLLIFKKPGEDAEKIRAGAIDKYNPGGGWITAQEWIEWAGAVWYGAHHGLPGGIRETDVLNVRQAKDTNDERHLAPLQLGVIERVVKLYSNPGDSVLSPYMGIGSEGYVALKLNRRFVGIEVKESYWRSAQENLRDAAQASEQRTLFDALDFIETAGVSEAAG